MAYDMSSFTNPDSTEVWLKAWASRHFGPALAQDVHNVVMQYSFLVGRRKFELLDGSTYSAINYAEADRVLAEWHTMGQTAQRIYDALHEDSRAASFEMILHPVLAGATVHDIAINLAKNQLYARQGRNSANNIVAHLAQMWKLDHDLMERYHKLLGGKWNHIMDQTHFYNNYW
jgi:hypothetical protein